MKNSVTYKIIFAVGRFGSVLVNCNDNTKQLAEEISGDRLDELVDNYGEIPTEIGIYTGLLTVEHQHYHADNEWELSKVTISGCLILNKLEL